MASQSHEQSPAQAAAPCREVGIVDAAYYLPGPARDIVEWGSARGVDASLVSSLIDNGCRHFYERTDASDADLVAEAILRLDRRCAELIPKVSYLLHAHTQVFSMPAPPSSILTDVARRFGIEPQLSFSCTHMACASAIAAVDWARRLLLADDSAEYALVVTADRVFGDEHRIRQDAGIQSDGASAILLGKSGLRCGLGPASYKNYAKLHEGPTSPENIAAIGRTTWLHTKMLFQEHSRASGIPLPEYGQIMPINADRHYWIQIAKALGLPAESMFLENIRERGHACSCDLVVNLVDRGFSLLDGGQSVLACGQSNVGAYTALTFVPATSSDGAGSAKQGAPACA